MSAWSTFFIILQCRLPCWDKEYASLENDSTYFLLNQMWMLLLRWHQENMPEFASIHNYSIKEDNLLFTLLPIKQTYILIIDKTLSKHTNICNVFSCGLNSGMPWSEWNLQHTTRYKITSSNTLSELKVVTWTIRPFLTSINRLLPSSFSSSPKCFQIFLQPFFIISCAYYTFLCHSCKWLRFGTA